MKIAIIGASGKLGNILVEKIINRNDPNIELTALVRSKNKVKSDIKVIEKDVMNIGSEDIHGYDVVVSAYGPSANDEDQLIKTTQHLINIFDHSKNTRLIICGGVGPLFTDKQKQMRISESPDVPDFAVKLAKAETESFILLEKNTSFDWIYFSPSLGLTYENAPETGKIIKAKDIMPVSDKGNLHLSYLDYASVIVDEIVNLNDEVHAIISVVGNN